MELTIDHAARVKHPGGKAHKRSMTTERTDGFVSVATSKDKHMVVR